MENERSSERWRLAWLLLGVCYAMLGFLFSVIQPLTALPDESAHMQYVKFLADERRLPVWSASGGGEAGYEAQHPPLAYVVQSVPWLLTRPLPENLRWHGVRWFMVVLGFLLINLTRRLGRRLFPESELHQLAYAATVVMLPLSLLYLCHPNPDGIALILSAATLLTAMAIHDSPVEHPRLPWAAGGLAALAALTKLSAMPLGLLLVLAQWRRPGQQPALRLRRTAAILGAWILGAGWWYARNLVQYGTPFIHTPTQYGSGLDLAAQKGVLPTLGFTLGETFLSTWVQRGWLPPGVDVLLYGLVTLVVIAAILGFSVGRWNRSRRGAGVETHAVPGPSRFALRASLFLVVSLLLGQQAAFWTQDMELNAGGRYMLVAMPGIAALVVAGLSRLRSARMAVVVLPVWMSLLLVMSVISAKRITGVLNPQYFPGWQMFEFPRR